jgi:hypothetical protein
MDTINASGSKSLSIVTDKTGTWQAVTQAWNGTAFVTAIDTCVVNAVPPPPPPPPTFTVALNTTPGGCLVWLDSLTNITTDASGYGVFNNVTSGNHTFTCTKTDYIGQARSENITSNRTLVFTLTQGKPGPCTPGALQCFGVDLYECNAAGTAWTLKTANSPTCQPEGEIPDFWTDPVGWVISTITAAWEAMLGFVSGQFNLFLKNIKNFQDNFVTQLVDFITDPVVHITAWTAGLIPTLSDWWDGIVDGIRSWYDTNIKPTVDAIGTKVDGVKSWINTQATSLTKWWDDVSKNITKWIDDAVKNANQWIKDFPTTIGDWWKTASKDVMDAIGSVWDDISGWIGEQWDNLGDWWDDQVTILQRGWDKVTSDIGTWFNDQIGILQRGWDETFAKIPDLIATTVSDIQKWTNETIVSMVGAMFEWAKGMVPDIKNASDSLGNLDASIATKSELPQSLKDALDQMRIIDDEITEIVKVKLSP